MPIFIMTGKYSQSALDNVSPQRTKKAEQLIARYEGTVKAMYALLGANDLFMVVELPSVEDALRVSISLTKLTGISFSTCPAISVDDFDMFAQLEQ